MQKFAGLGTDCLDDLRVTMADSADSPAGEHVQYPVAVGVDKIIAFALDDSTRQAAVVGDNVLVKHRDYFCGVHQSESFKTG